MTTEQFNLLNGRIQALTDIMLMLTVKLGKSEVIYSYVFSQEINTVAVIRALHPELEEARNHMTYFAGQREDVSDHVLQQLLATEL